jgi:hypothetical protein
LWGRLYRGESTVTEVVIDDERCGPYEPPPLEVLDATDTDKAQSAQFPPFLRLQWRGHAAYSNYAIEQWAGAAWERRATVPEAGSGYLSWCTPRLEDGAQHRWRVTPYDARGHAGDPTEVAVELICSPEPAPIAMSYSAATRLVTVSEVA